MGGVVPLGYDVKDRQLVVNTREAEMVRYIFQRYVDVGSVSGLKEQLDAEGIVSKPRKSSNARLRGAKPMGRGMLYHLLRNRLYLGEITHKGEAYPGLHDAIVKRALWDQARLCLDANRTNHRMGTHARNPSLLAGLLYDDNGERMSPSHAVKNGKRYRYYVSQSLIRQPKRMAIGGRRIPAGDIEELMVSQVKTFLDDEGHVANAIQIYVSDAPRQRHALEKARQLASRWDDATPTERRGMLLQLIKRIEVHHDRVDIKILPARLAGMLLGEELKLPPDTDLSPEQLSGEKNTLVLSIPARFKRAGLEMKLLVDEPGGNQTSRGPDPSLIKIIVKAHRLKNHFIHNHGHSVKALAKQQGVNPSYFTRLIRLTFLAPDITQAILEGRHPRELTAHGLMGNTRFPLSWREQRLVLGFI